MASTRGVEGAVQDIAQMCGEMLMVMKETRDAVKHLIDVVKKQDKGGKECN